MKFKYFFILLCECIINFSITAINKEVQNSYNQGTIITNDNSELFNFRGRTDYCVLDDYKSFDSGSFAVRFLPDAQSINSSTVMVLFETVTTNDITLKDINGTWGLAFIYFNGAFRWGFHSNDQSNHFIEIKNLPVNYQEFTNIFITWNDGVLNVYLKDYPVQTFNYNKDLKINSTSKIMIGSGTLNNSTYKGYMKDIIYENRIYDQKDIAHYINASYSLKNNKSVNISSMIKNNFGYQKDLKIVNNKIFFNGQTSYFFMRNIYENNNLSAIDLDFEITQNKQMHIIQTTNDFPEKNSGWGYSLNYDPKLGIVFYLNTAHGLVTISTGKKLKLFENYNIKIHVDLYDIQIYLNNKRIIKSNYYKTFHDRANFIMIGSGFAKNYYASIVINNLTIYSEPKYLTIEDSKKTTTIINKSKIAFPKPDPKLFLYTSIASYTLSGLTLTLLPVFFTLHTVNSYYYNELYSLYSKSTNQNQIDIYYKQMKLYSDYSNMLLISGSIMIPLSLISFTSGLLLQLTYQHINIKNVPNLNVSYNYSDKKIEFSLKVEL